MSEEKPKVKNAAAYLMESEKLRKAGNPIGALAVIDEAISYHFENRDFHLEKAKIHSALIEISDDPVTKNTNLIEALGAAHQAMTIMYITQSQVTDEQRAPKTDPFDRYAEQRREFSS